MSESGVFSFQWHLTDRCNLRCRHCYQSDFGPRADLDRAGLTAILDSLFLPAPGASWSVNLTGGEPLLFPHLEFVMERLEAEPAVTGYSLITNATVLPPARLRSLSRLRKLEYIKVSLEGADEASNDPIRGRGSFQRALRGMEILQKELGKPLVLMFTLGGWNVEQIGPVAGLARRLGLAGIIFERFVPLGSGARLAAQVLRAALWRRALENILRAAGVHIPAGDLAGHHAFWLDFSRGLKTSVCNLGRSLALMPDGTVYPCRRLPLLAGNALRDKFSDLIATVAAYSPQRLKPDLKGLFCGGCPLEECAGCRALALAVAGDFLADDPCCLLSNG